MRMGALIVCAALLCGQTKVSDRVKSIRDLEKTGGATTLPELRGYLKDPELQVRVEAVKAIVRIGSQHSLDPLMEALNDNDAEIQIRAIDGLVNFYYPGYVQTGLTASIKRVGNTIRTKFSDTNDQVVDPFVEARADIQEQFGALAGSGANIEVRANAARAAGVVRAKVAVPGLIEALRSKDTQVLYEVANAFRKIGDPAAAPSLRFLFRDLDDKVQVTALQTAGVLQNREVLPALITAFNTARNVKAAAAALGSIAMFPDPANRGLFEQYLKDKDENMRAAAAEGVARLRVAADIARLEPSFNEEKKMAPRLALAFGLSMLGKRDTSEFSPLRYLINTLNSAAYRKVAFAYLVELARDPAIRGAIYPMMTDRTKEEKKYLAGVFGASATRDAVPILEALSKDPDTEVAQEGTRALRNLRARL